jgi:two-component system KDP operon response regulator KdpE
MRVLIIEDDRTIVDFIKIVLKVGMPLSEVTSTHLGTRGIELVEEIHPNIILLDLGLPDISGFEVLKEVRKSSSVPVLILSVKSEETAIAGGLSLGADDYLIKPVRQLELLARIQNLLKREGLQKTQKIIKAGPLTFDQSLREVQLGERRIALTKTEGTILYQLMLGNGNIVTVAALSRAIWGSDYNATDSIKVYIYQLRKKLEDNPSFPKIILSKPRIGYYLSSES